MTVTLALPAELTIYTAAETRQQWLAWLAAGDAQTLQVDASGVTEVDAAGLQLVVALGRSLGAQQRRLRLACPSPTLRGACERLGLSSLLDTASPAGDGA